VGERQHRPFQLSFNSSLKVDFQGARVTSDGGLILVRELDERSGLAKAASARKTTSLLSLCWRSISLGQQQFLPALGAVNVSRRSR
jgi:hypothetical protein